MLPVHATCLPVRVQFEREEQGHAQAIYFD